ncbi:MAG TPA: peptide chain release factor N(5)-glutamine methyltransferase [Gaiellaceae bacterium]|nr:peptide chain release factor N(5)-glutamine methyltransferase [Gaiellaceae bacterium]
MTALDAVREVARDLEAAGVPSPRVDAEHLVAHALGATRTQLYASNGGISAQAAERLRGLVSRRRAREPLAYVLGEWGFRRLTLAVDRRALVPRPETEVVVERCLAALEGFERPRVLDVGVGSGAIALALADEHPGVSVVAVDRSRDALALARENLRRLDRDGFAARVDFVHGDLLAGVAGPFDLVVSNPPYVPAAEYEALQPEIRLYEPYDAVVGEGVWERIAAAARPALRARGRLVLECGDGQAGEVAAGLRRLGYEEVVTTADLAGRPRVVEGTRPWPPCQGSDPRRVPR